MEKRFASLPTPSYVIDEARLEENGKILQSVARNTQCKILLAQKAFSNYDFYPLLSRFLDGSEASGLFEARLGREQMPDKEVHVFSAAYRADEFAEITSYADHIVFNSISQYRKYAPLAKGKSLGIRVNPECSTQEGHAIYDPCAKGSRLGVTKANMEPIHVDGLHFHTLCEQNADALEITLKAIEEKFPELLEKVAWVNMGGGHHITRKDYDIPLLEKLIKDFKKKWNVEVYLEPGEAVALNAGYLITRVLDIVHNGDTDIAILDASAACHMPDVIEMPYKPPLYNSKDEGYAYRLAGPTCLAGDVIGDYCFDHKLEIDELLVFEDMAIYTTCKNNTFNGMPLPNIYRLTKQNTFEQLTHFGYQDFKRRLGSTNH